MNNQQLAQEIRKHLPSDNRYWKRNGTHFHGYAPYRAGSDSMALHVDFENNRFFDHVEHQGGGFTNLARKLGIQVNSGFTPIQTELPDNLSEYELFRGLPQDYLKNKNWRDGTFENRKGIFIPNPLGIDQFRFLDGNQPKYKPVKDLPKDENGNTVFAIYGLRDAMAIAKKHDLPYLVHCNGAISAEVAQYHEIPAFAVLCGENSIPERYARKVLEVTDLSILISLDSDKSGKLGTQKLAEWYGDRGIVIDLPAEFGSGFDLCDFCILFKDANPQNLISDMAQSAYNARPPRTIKEAGDIVLKQLKGEIEPRGRTIPSPFTRLHQFGGFATWMQPGFMSGVIAVSGGGKTMYWQTLVELLVRQSRKWGVIVDSREFRPEDDFARKITQNTTPIVNYDDIQKHLQYQQMKRERANGMTLNDDEIAIGVEMGKEKFEALESFQNRMKFYSGHMEYADEKFYIEDTLDYMYRVTLERREHGKYIDLWIFDYLTLYRLKIENQKVAGTGIYNVILDLIKAKARKANVHALVLLQTNKEPTTDLNERNKLLGISDISYANEQHFNFIMSINPLTGVKSEQIWNDSKKIYEYAPVRNISTGEYLRDRAKLRGGNIASVWKCLKNTNGQVGWALKVRADYERLTWRDEDWSNSDLCLPLNYGSKKGKS